MYILVNLGFPYLTREISLYQERMGLAMEQKSGQCAGQSAGQEKIKALEFVHFYYEKAKNVWNNVCSKHKIN